MEDASSPVLVVGAGPAGMTAALELARWGVPVRIVDRQAEPPTTSRAVGVQARTLELFEQRGLSETLVEEGNPAEAASAWGGGERLFRLEFSRIASRFNFLLFVSQAVTERVLRGALDAAGVRVERGVTLDAVATPHRDGPVTAVLRRADGSLEELQTPYLVDCEGAHSAVRDTLDLDFKGKSLESSYALGDLHVEGDLPEHDFHIFSSGGGFMGMFPMGGGRWRLIASDPISEPSKGTEPSLEELQKIYDERSPVPARFHGMTWSSWFHINSRMTGRMRVGRIFLAGDAAHIHSPAGAQGMNTGIQDAIDLAWKLALVMKGRAADALLDTYGADRLPVIKNVLEKTEGLTDLIGSENPLVRTAFNHVAPWVVGLDAVQGSSTTRMSQIGLDYRGSPLSKTRSHHGTLRAGDRVPDLSVRVLPRPGEGDAWGGTERLQLKLDPLRFTLLVVNPADRDATHAELSRRLAPWADLIDGLQVAAGDGEGDAERFEEALGSGPALLLVRPDAYVGFLGGGGDAEHLEAWLREWLPVPAPDAS